MLNKILNDIRSLDSDFEGTLSYELIDTMSLFIQVEEYEGECKYIYSVIECDPEADRLVVVDMSDFADYDKAKEVLEDLIGIGIYELTE